MLISCSMSTWCAIANYKQWIRSLSSNKRWNNLNSNEKNEFLRNRVISFSGSFSFSKSIGACEDPSRRQILKWRWRMNLPSETDVIRGLPEWGRSRVLVVVKLTSQEFINRIPLHIDTACHFINVHTCLQLTNNLIIGTSHFPSNVAWLWLHEIK